MCPGGSLERARVSGTEEALYQALPLLGGLSALELGW